LPWPEQLHSKLMDHIARIQIDGVNSNCGSIPLLLRVHTASYHSTLQCKTFCLLLPRIYDILILGYFKMVVLIPLSFVVHRWFTQVLPAACCPLPSVVIWVYYSDIEEQKIQPWHCQWGPGHTQQWLPNYYEAGSIWNSLPTSQTFILI
jgi:hypothetical protein